MITCLVTSDIASQWFKKSIPSPPKCSSLFLASAPSIKCSNLVLQEVLRCHFARTGEHHIQIDIKNHLDANLLPIFLPCSLSVDNFFLHFSKGIRSYLTLFFWLILCFSPCYNVECIYMSIFFRLYT